MTKPARSSSRDHARPDVDSSNDATVTAHQTSPDRYVFTEADNDEGWIATDLAVEPKR